MELNGNFRFGKYKINSLTTKGVTESDDNSITFIQNEPQREKNVEKMNRASVTCGVIPKIPNINREEGGIYFFLFCPHPYPRQSPQKQSSGGCWEGT